MKSAVLPALLGPTMRIVCPFGLSTFQKAYAAEASEVSRRGALASVCNQAVVRMTYVGGGWRREGEGVVPLKRTGCGDPEQQYEHEQGHQRRKTGASEHIRDLIGHVAGIHHRCYSRSPLGDRLCRRVPSHFAADRQKRHAQ